MGTDVQLATLRSTPEAAQALRQMQCSAAWRVDEPAEIKRWLTADARSVLPLARNEAMVWLTPAGSADFKRLLAPTLALVAPVGLSQADQVAWFASAAETLAGIPADLLEIGCRAARETVDHHAKIIPAVLAAVRQSWNQRRQDLARINRIAEVANGKRDRKPWETEGFDEASRCSPMDAAAIMEEFGIASAEPKPGFRPLPTVDDYLREIPGLTRAAAQKLVDEQKRQVAGRSVGDVLAA